MKAIDDSCIHQILVRKETKPADQGGFNIYGECLDCDDLMVIADCYRFVSGDVYVLRGKYINAKGCRE